ncbi:AraC family transcriptional regulator [Pseudomonas bubulae]|uniref:AraC family transcriptional regulator n=1 Tax=Pseudomonas bubulae TaxID=2316085 RepID=UPI00102F5975|nr:helix-turn-helix transcriptional regulator [Pseudomonas bubulae]
MPVSLYKGANHRKRGVAIKPLNDFLLEIDRSNWTVIGSATDYPQDWIIPGHTHEKHQLLYAIAGVMVVYSESSQWTVPSNRGVWMPSGRVHSIRCVGPLKMRSVFVRPDALVDLPAEIRAVSISPLLSELIKVAVGLKLPYTAHTREGRVMQLILDELALLPALPLHLPRPADHRINDICLRLQKNPADSSTLADWSTHLGLDEKTIQRLFRKETGMTFGQWRQQARLLLAVERMAVGEKIIDVAFSLGYESPSAFTNMFKKQFGKTPSHFFK